MTAASESRLCAKTGLRIIAAHGKTSIRVAKDRSRGALTGWKNAKVGRLPAELADEIGDPRGRYDTLGSTIYLADSRRCAYAEVLIGFRRKRASIAKVADAIGWDVDEFMVQVEADARSNGVDVPWAISVDWQMDRSIYEIQLPREGWWVLIDDADTLPHSKNLAPGVEGMTEQLQLLTSGSVVSDNRALTTLLANCTAMQFLTTVPSRWESHTSPKH